MAEKVNSTHKIEKIEEINDFNNNFGTWLQHIKTKTLQKFNKSSFLDGMIKALGSIKEEDFDGGEIQKKALMDSLISKKWILKRQMKKNK